MSASWRPRGWSDSCVFFTNKRLVRQLLFRLIRPQLAPYNLMQMFSKSFGQTIGQCFYQNYMILIVVGFVARYNFIQSETGGNRKTSHIIRNS